MTGMNKLALEIEDLKERGIDVTEQEALLDRMEAAAEPKPVALSALIEPETNSRNEGGDPNLHQHMTLYAGRFSPV